MYQRDKVTQTNQSMQEREVHKVVLAFNPSITAVLYQPPHTINISPSTVKPLEVDRANYKQ